MPSKSEAAAHDAGFAKRMGIPVDVAREFVMADKNKSFSGSKPKNRRRGS